MTNRLEDLQRILEEVRQNPDNVSSETRKYFWKLVRQIKRNPHPNDDEIVLASEIRGLLFEVDRGRTFRLGPALALMILLGLGPLITYIWLLGTPLDWSNVFGWSLTDLWTLVLRFVCVMGVVAFFYPLGRVIAGKVLGIRLLGMCRDEYYEPTIKIDYVSFLKAPASNRKWFFFFAGFWTIITSIIVGVLGLFIGGDLTGFIPAFVLLIFEGYVVAKGSAKKSSGEMGHYNREKKIEKAWKIRLAEEQQS
ncbi:MAG: hypothetical protein RTU30_08045 [Candidatus Thorarchaeota archaeon]